VPALAAPWHLFTDEHPRRCSSVPGSMSALLVGVEAHQGVFVTQGNDEKYALTDEFCTHRPSLICVVSQHNASYSRPEATVYVLVPFDT
jgi:hypothetical protein